MNVRSFANQTFASTLTGVAIFSGGVHQRRTFAWDN